MSDKGKEFEELVHYVYASLLKMEERNAIISKNVIIRGNDNTNNEFDVYYEFKKVGIPHRVAIECKNHSRPIERMYIHNFAGKLESVAPMQGVMISVSGYQEGAYEIAKKKGIILLEEKDLPRFNEILAEQFKFVFLPDENASGEPFWTLMEIENGENNGNYVCMPSNAEYDFIIPLFISKKVAETFKQKYYGNRECAVRGIRREQLFGLVEFTKIHNIIFWLVLSQPEEDGFDYFILTTEKLRKNYL
ncbi:restriction endonuclease [Ruminiclostridium herbifermentans]|uniref:Restriction endonuclease n=1 Tax=Ruminiclostridium herbifermentans TaxID=2488810 RepID=A0A4U7JBR9_9FIRM|nr:restriction endonuclease [Ruminiclostridium herbifermentans]QNU66505.1 restriction endonuclease [Ruminiclostridium herbifermentans]